MPDCRTNFNYGFDDKIINAIGADAAGNYISLVEYSVLLDDNPFFDEYHLLVRIRFKNNTYIDYIFYEIANTLTIQKSNLIEVTHYG